MQNVLKWLDNHLTAFTARFLNYICPFWGVKHQSIKSRHFNSKNTKLNT